MSRLVYLICTTNRSGSSWLCAMLRSTGLLGRIGEWRRYRTPTKQTIADVWKGNHDVDPFGLKLNSQAYRSLWPVIEPQDRRNMRHVWLTRDDQWAQAISQYVAVVTGQWHLPPAERRSDIEVPFDAERILKYRDNFRAQNAWWDRWFRKRNPLRVTYEQLVENPEEGARSVLRHLNLYADVIDTDWSSKMADPELVAEWTKKLETLYP